MKSKSRKFALILFTILFVVAATLVFFRNPPDLKADKIAKSLLSPMTIGYKQKFGEWPTDLAAIRSKATDSTKKDIDSITSDHFHVKFKPLSETECEIALSRGQSTQEKTYVASTNSDPKQRLQYAYFE